jgi:NAD/NADP transhydrogenase beta subunit
VTAFLAVSSSVETPWFVQATYIVAAACFIMALKLLNDPKTARQGVWPSSARW